MKKILAMLAATMLLSVGCADSKLLPVLDSKGKVTSTKWYPSVGLFNTMKKSPDVCYQIVIGNVVWSMLLFETLVAPVYFVGWSIMEPVALKAHVDNPEGCW